MLAVQHRSPQSAPPTAYRLPHLGRKLERDQRLYDPGPGASAMAAMLLGTDGGSYLVPVLDKPVLRISGKGALVAMRSRRVAGAPRILTTLTRAVGSGGRVRCCATGGIDQSPKKPWFMQTV